MLVGIHAVVFDLDGTLLNRRLSLEQINRDQWERLPGLRECADEAHYVQAAIEHDLDGYAPRREMFARVLARFGLSPELAGTLLEDYRAMFPRACVLFPDATETLEALRAAGLKLALITNGSARMQRGKLKCLAIEPAFDTILISEAEGVSKPDPRIFRLALERLNTTADRAVFVGDHPDVDVAGARSAGMKAVWRRDPAVSRNVPSDAEIEELRDLLRLLGIGR
jgi:putative hydrolase of the HAD superfamily